MTEPLPVAEAEEEQERARLSAHRECCPALSSCRSHGKIRYVFLLSPASSSLQRIKLHSSQALRCMTEGITVGGY